MKLVLFKDNLSTGRGADKLYCSLAEELSLLGWNVTLVTHPTNSPLTFELAPHIHLEYVTSERVREFVKDFDVCLAAGSNEILTLTRWGRVKSPVKTITTMLLAPEGFFKWRRFYRNRCIKRAFNLSDGLQVLCNEYLPAIRKFAPCPITKTIAEWPDVKAPQTSLHQTKTILYPAAINRHKNQMLLIKAFAGIAREFPEWQVHLYGIAKDNYGAACEKAVAKFGLSERIKFLGFTQDLPSAYAHASIMAFPSLLEGFPLTVIEGFRYGLPAVMVEKLPGAHEMVEDGVTGFITAGTPESYAAGLRKLMSNPELLKQMEQTTQQACEEKFAKNRILQQWDEFLKIMPNR